MQKSDLRTYLLILMLSSPFIVLGQDLYLIPHIGFNLSTYNFTESVSNASNQRLAGGLTAGFGLNIPMNSRRTFIIQPEINYVMKNLSIDHYVNPASVDGSGTDNSVLQRTMMHYIEVPLLARVDFGIGTRYYLNAGPVASFALAGREKITSYLEGVPSENISADFDNRFYRMDWGVQVGGGIEIPFNDTFLLVDGRYAFGFRDLYRTRSQITPPDPTQDPAVIGPDGKNRIFTLSIGYALPL